MMNGFNDELILAARLFLATAVSDFRLDKAERPSGTGKASRASLTAERHVAWIG
jgi:hypothetical protein